MSIQASASQTRKGFKRLKLPERPRNERGWVMFLGDFVAIALAWYIANRIYFSFHIQTSFVGPNHLPVIEIFSLERTATFVGLLLLFRQLGHYRDRIHYFFQLRSIFIAGGLGVVAESVSRLYFESPTSTLGIFIAWGLIIFFVMSLRIVTSNLVCSRPSFLQPVVILSDGRLGRHASKAIKRKTRLGYRLSGIETRGDRNWGDLADSAIRNFDEMALTEMKKKANESDPGTLFLYAFDTFDEESVARAVKYLEQLDRPFGFITSRTGIRLPSFKEFPFYGEDIILLLPHQKDTPLLSRMVKRCFDVSLATLLIIALAPLLLIFAALISLDGGPVVFSHSRIGRFGKIFDCLKFRSMSVDADSRLSEHLESNEAARQEWQEAHKLKNDPRVTGIGSFLRTSSLDELAQLYNILRGDMSFVGPRPIVEAEIVKYGSTFSHYCEVRPGITGLWQVSGRNNTSYEERVELDKWYVENRSLWLDLFILFKTVPVVLLRRGAF